MPVTRAEAELSPPIYWNRIGQYLVFSIPSLVLIAVVLRFLGFTEISGQTGMGVTVFLIVSFIVFYSKDGDRVARNYYQLRYWVDGLKLGFLAALFAMLLSFAFSTTYYYLWYY